MDCGPTCLRMVAAFYGKRYKLETLRERSYLSREGVSMLGIAQAAESIGFRTMGVKITPDQLISEAPLPAIIHWLQDHFVVLYKITGKKGKGKIPCG
jgi:ATP-binding cassette, subfamily B, bacterial